MQHPLPWDAIDCMLAWRFNVVDNLRGGELPLWSPYTYLGFPLHADPECGAWYPVLWFIGAIRPYDFLSLNFEWCLHVFIAGLGMHRLMKSLRCSDAASYVAGVSFMCSGMFVSNAHNLICLIGIVWFPWLFLYVRKMLITLHWKDALVASLFSFLMVSGSYPGITIIAAYILTFYVVRIVIVRRKELNEAAMRMKWIRTFIVFILVSIALSSVVIVSTAEVLPYITRTEGLRPDQILDNPLSPPAMISFVLPFAVGNNEYNWGSDFTMLNVYCGLITLLLAVYTFTQRKRASREWLMLAATLTLLMAAVGDILPFRMWLTHLPGLDSFRHPSLFRFFIIFFICVLGGLGFQKMAQNADKRRITLVIAATGLFMAILAIFLLPTSIPRVFEEVWKNWKGPPEQISISIADRIFIQSLMQVILLSTVIVFIRLGKTKWIVAMVALDMLLSVQLNSASSVFSPFDVREMNKKLHSAVASTPQYDGRSLKNICDSTINTGVPAIWRNESIYLHQPAWDGYNSFKFRFYEQLETAGNLGETLDHPLVYLPDSLAGRVEKIELHANSVIATVNTSRSTPLILQQNFLPAWKCRINNQWQEVDRASVAMMGVNLPVGASTVEFYYQPTTSLAAMWVTLGSIFICAILLLRRK